MWRKRTTWAEDTVARGEARGGEEGVVPVQDDQGPGLEGFWGLLAQWRRSGSYLRNRRGRRRVAGALEVEALGEGPGDLLLYLIVAVHVSQRVALRTSSGCGASDAGCRCSRETGTATADPFLGAVGSGAGLGRWAASKAHLHGPCVAVVSLVVVCGVAASGAAGGLVPQLRRC